MSRPRVVIFSGNIRRPSRSRSLGDCCHGCFGAGNRSRNARDTKCRLTFSTGPGPSTSLVKANPLVSLHRWEASVIAGNLACLRVNAAMTL